jgi:hypothetical protein
MQLSQEEYNLLICATLKFLPSETFKKDYEDFFQCMKGLHRLVLSEEEIIRTLSTVFSTDYTDEMKEFFQKILAIEPAVSQKNQETQEKSRPNTTLTKMKVYERQILDAFEVCFQFRLMFIFHLFASCSLISTGIFLEAGFWDRQGHLFQVPARGG